jgi:RHS repeat-associated protein
MRRILTRRRGGFVGACLAGLALPSVVASGAVESGFGVAAGGGLASGEESFKTDLFTGAATLSIPLVVPAGANGFQPDLALTYNSQRGNGWVGRGWDLSLPSIARITKFGMPSYSDHPVSGDRFALDDDRLVRDDAGIYRTMRDNFARIQAVESPPGTISHWIVRRTDGTTQSFGSTPDSRIQTTLPNQEVKTFRWLLSRTEDPNGNYIRYEYTAAPTNDPDDGQAYPTRISYSFAGDEAAGSATLRTVDFTLSTTNRLDKTIVYTGGARTETSRRLESIAMRAGGQLVTRYDLEYVDEAGADPPNRASLLRRVERVGADGTSTLPADVFSYSGGSDPQWSSDPDLEARLEEIGIDDMASGTWRFLDVNGDAAPDLVSTGGNGWRVHLNTREGSLFPATMPISVFPPRAGFDEGTLWVDYTGDGRIDVISGIGNFGQGPLSELHSFENTGLDWQDTPAFFNGLHFPIVVDPSCNAENPPVRERTVMADVNGDGLPDFLHARQTVNTPRGSCSLYADPANWTVRAVFLNSGSGWGENTTWTSALDALLDDPDFDVLLNQLIFVDLNGDGLVDVGRDQNLDGAIDSDSVIRLNNGWGWVEDSEFSAPNGLRAVDLDGDGLVDRLTGSAQFGNGTVFAGSFPVPSPWGTTGADRAIVDLDGDGLADLVRANASSGVQARRATAAVPPDLLVGIQHAAGAATALTYAPSTAGSCHDDLLGGCQADFVYLFADSAASETFCTAPFEYAPAAAGAPAGCTLAHPALPFVVQHVAAVTVDDANGNVRTDSIRYDKGYFDSSEREFRGFGTAAERPHRITYAKPKGEGTADLGILRIREFYQLAFLRGALARETLYASPDGEPEPTADEVEIEQSIHHFAATRGDLATTLLLHPTQILTQGCDPQLSDVQNPAARPDCQFIDLQTDAYASLLSLPAPQPWSAFQDDFCRSGGPNPSNRDCGFAYLVLPVGNYVIRRDATDPVASRVIRWFDYHGNTQAEWTLDDLADPSADRLTVVAFAAPAPGAPSNFFSQPSFVVRQTSPDQSPTTAVLERTQIDYDAQPNGLVLRGNVTAAITDLEDPVNGDPMENPDTTVRMTRTYPATGNVGLPQAVSDPFTPGEPVRSTSLGYDPRKSFVTQATRGGLTVTTSYDPPNAPPGLGLVASVVDENGAQVTFTADAFGRPRTQTGPSPIGKVEERVYGDFAGVSSTNPRLTVKRFDGTIDAGGNLVAVESKAFTDGFGRTIRTEWDGLDASDAAAKIEQSTTHDVLGRVAFQTRPRLVGTPGTPPGTRLFYDVRGRLRFVKQPDDGVQEVSYDGLLTTTFDAENRRTDIRRDGAGLVVAVTEYPATVAQVTSYRHDPLGRLTLVCYAVASSCGTQSGPGGLSSASDPRHSLVVDYDTLGRRVRVVDPNLGDWRYHYDGSGNLLSRTDALGRTVSYGYDTTHGRLKTENWDGSGPSEVTLTYGDELLPPPAHSKGRVVTSAEPAVVLTHGYDSAGRTVILTTQFPNDGGTHTVSSGYDWWDRTTSTTYPDGEVVNRRYDRMGVERVDSSQRVYVSDVKHNPEGRVVQLDYGNGTVREMGYDTTTGHLESLRGRPATGADFLSKTYTSDRTARVASIGDGVDAAEALAAIAYDGVGRLKNATRGGMQSLGYAFDALGNLVSKEGAAQPFSHPTKPHALFDATHPGRFAYDANGNLTRRDGSALAYDTMNRLVSVSGRLPSSYAYERGGERVRKQHGADVSRFLGPDYEIQNGVRFVKTIRAEGAVVAQVSIGPGPGGGAETPTGRRKPLDPAALAGALAALAALGAISGLLARRAATPAWERALATGLCVALATGPGLPALAAAPGDVVEDGRLDPADLLALQRALTDAQYTLTSEQQQAADVAPFVDGEPAGNAALDAADLLVLLRGLSSEDVDGDGLLGAEDPVPLSRSNFDRDQDGLDDEAEAVLGTNPAGFDSDGDGLVDGKDGEPLVPAGTQVLFVHADHLGGSAVVTNAAGAVVRRVRYGLFGEVRANDRVGPPATLDPAEKYTGQRFDAETGLAYYGARYYDPASGRFASPDPIVDLTSPQSLNRYGYVLNDPLDLVDSTGYWSAEIGLGIGSLSYSSSEGLDFDWGPSVGIGYSTGDYGVGSGSGFSAYASYTDEGPRASFGFHSSERIYGFHTGYSVNQGREAAQIPGDSMSAGGAPAGGVRASQSREGAQTVTPGRINSGEPIASPHVRAGMREAWIDALPGTPQQREQGGWTMRYTGVVQAVRSAFGYPDTGVVRVPAGSAHRIHFSDPPSFGEVTGRFHVHADPVATQRPSDPEDLGGVTPHYVISHEGVFRVNADRTVNRLGGFEVLWGQ